MNALEQQYYAMFEAGYKSGLEAVGNATTDLPIRHYYEKHIELNGLPTKIQVSEVVAFRGVTKLDLDPDMLLENNKGEFKELVLMGYTPEGKFIFASSMADGGDVVWMLELAKLKLFKITGDI